MPEVPGHLVGRVAIVTGAGRGLGRSHALLLAAEGAAVVVNDLGGTLAGDGRDETAAEQVVGEIERAGGRAVASSHDVADWDQAEALVELARASFGDLHVLVNNAGILRDRTLANISEEEWDGVVRVHLKGHAAMTHHALAYWRARSKSGAVVHASVVHTSSVSGLLGGFGQANYAAAKLGIVALSATAALEGARYGVRSNVVSPAARTRLSLSVPSGAPQPEPASGTFDPWDPANVSPVVAWLASEGCAETSQVYHVYGSELFVLRIPEVVQRLSTQGRWTIEACAREVPPHAAEPVGDEAFFPGVP
jgi:NAD(P)-dependent dehydrogenase (short-subunit alcohol dehydrogenase family)